jgi:hypothetical protein
LFALDTVPTQNQAQDIKSRVSSISESPSDEQSFANLRKSMTKGTFRKRSLFGGSNNDLDSLRNLESR